MQRVVDALVARQPRSIAVQQAAVRCLSSSPSLLAYESPLLPVCLRQAEGSRIVDVDGNAYVDCHMAGGANLLGHNSPLVADAVRHASLRGLQGGQFFEEQVQLAELVRRMAPGTERVALFHTGGEAVAAAVRMACAVTRRHKVAKFEGCYHGATDVGLHNTSMLLSGRPPADPAGEIPPRADTGGVGTDEAIVILPFNAATAFERLRAEAPDLACIVVDPVPPFMSAWPDDCRQFVRQLCAAAAEAGVPVIFDEAVCGFRLARGGAREWLDAVPQMSVFANGASALGIPLSIAAGDARFLDAARTSGLFRDYGPPKVWVSSTLQANYLAVVASLTQLSFVADHHAEIVGVIDRNHARLNQRLAEFAARSGILVSLQGHPRLQLQIALGPHEPRERSYRGVMDLSSPAHLRSLLALTFYLRLHGIYTKTLPTISLSASHTAEDIDTIAAGIERSLVQMRQDGMLPPGA
jgi:glutamate-1-semialdehyde 2,1-aminomutase